jgi:hypothetical protein
MTAWHRYCTPSWRETTMSSNSPILFALFALIVAAFWYDASVASVNAANLTAPGQMR